LAYVINFEIPNIPETYVHRIGRTGRAGASGTALSFCDAEEMAYLKDIHKLIGKTVPVVENHAYPMENMVVAKPAAKPQPQKSFQRSDRNGPPNNRSRRPFRR
jgi:ATP-dependent RNA helicase RhlE